MPWIVRSLFAINIRKLSLTRMLYCHFYETSLTSFVSSIYMAHPLMAFPISFYKHSPQQYFLFHMTSIEFGDFLQFTEKIKQKKIMLSFIAAFSLKHSYANCLMSVWTFYSSAMSLWRFEKLLIGELFLWYKHYSTTLK